MSAAAVVEPLPAVPPSSSQPHPTPATPSLDFHTFNGLIHQFLVGREFAVEVAGNHDLSLRELAELLSSPRGLEIFEAHRKLLELRIAATLAEAQVSAIQTLHRLARDSDREETARRAAAALLRFKITAPQPAPAPAPEQPEAAAAPRRHHPLPEGGGKGGGQSNSLSAPSHPSLPHSALRSRQEQGTRRRQGRRRITSSAPAPIASPQPDHRAPVPSLATQPTATPRPP